MEKRRRSDLVLGALIGVFNGIAVAVVVAHAYATKAIGAEGYSYILFGSHSSPASVASCVLSLGIPYGAMIGMMAGSMSDEAIEGSRMTRRLAYLLISISALGITGVVWPPLFIWGVGPTIFFTLTLEVVTHRSRYEFPRAQVITS